jgi:hypothetical protein
MTPGNPFLKELSGIPVDKRIIAHTICGIRGHDVPPAGGDGVVRYESAHMEGVESELIVPYAHSMQARPDVIAEVKRILMENMQGYSSPAPLAASRE